MKIARSFVTIFLATAPMSDADDSLSADREKSENDSSGKAEQLRERQLQGYLDSGLAGPLQVEFTRLLRSDFSSTHARRTAISEWNKKNRESLMAEREALRMTRPAPSMEAQRRSKKAQAQQVDRWRDQGAIGPLEAEWLKGRARGASDGSGRSRPPVEVEAERAERRSVLAASQIPTPQELERIRAQVGSDEKNGKIGPIEAEWRLLLLTKYSDPIEKRNAIRVWRESNQVALRDEGVARRRPAAKE